MPRRGFAGAGANDMMLLPNNASARLGHSWMIAQQHQVFSAARLTLVSPEPSVDPQVEQCLPTDQRGPW